MNIFDRFVGKKTIVAPPAAVSVPRRDPLMDGSGGWSMPVFDSGMTFKEVGSAGLRQFSGWVREEFLPQLQGRQAARVYREMMDNNATVGAILFAITQTMREIDWRVEPASDKPEAQAEAEFVDSLRDDMTHTWEDFIAEALSMCGYGFAPHEIVYKRRLGLQDEATDLPSSKYDDGRIGIRKLPIRGQDTVLKWFFDPNGGVRGLTQQPWIGPLIDLPIEKLLLFRPTAHKNNPEGRSILRNAYHSWFYTKRIQEQEAITFERLGGLPAMYVPSSLLEAAASSDAKAVAALNAYKKIVTNVRIDEQMGIILPSDVYQGPNGPTGAKMFEFALVTPGASRTNIDPDKIIERYKLDIMTTVLADFLQLGHASRGTQSLAISKIDLFFQGIEGWMNSIAAVLNRYLLPRLWKLNALDPDLMPKYVPELVQRVDLDGLSNFVLRLSQAGMPLFPDAELESVLRDAAGLPDLVDDPGALTAKPVANPATTQKIVKAAIARRVKKLRGI